MLPVELARHDVKNRDEASHIELTLLVNSDLFWFEGHFAGQPLLPGVAQLDWAMHYALALLAPGWTFSSVENIKFQRPILPGTTLRLRLTWHTGKRRLSFSYAIWDGETECAASSGKIKLTPVTEYNPCQ